MKEQESKSKLKSLYEYMDNEELRDFIEGLEIELIRAKDEYVKRFVPKERVVSLENPPTWKWL